MNYSGYETKYGCYAWDDIENKPLEMVILNSSYHSAYNVEWKMLNRILYCELYDLKVNVTLNNHSDPIVLNEYGISLDITQQGWRIGCNKTEIIDALNNNEQLNVSALGENAPTSYIISFRSINNSQDMIDLGKLIVKVIQSAATS